MSLTQFILPFAPSHYFTPKVNDKFDEEFIGVKEVFSPKLGIFQATPPAEL